MHHYLMTLTCVPSYGDDIFTRPLYMYRISFRKLSKGGQLEESGFYGGGGMIVKGVVRL